MALGDDGLGGGRAARRPGQNSSDYYPGKYVGQSSSSSSSTSRSLLRERKPARAAARPAEAPHPSRVMAEREAYSEEPCIVSVFYTVPTFGGASTSWTTQGVVY